MCSHVMTLVNLVRRDKFSENLEIQLSVSCGT